MRYDIVVSNGAFPNYKFFRGLKSSARTPEEPTTRSKKGFNGIIIKHNLNEMSVIDSEQFSEPRKKGTKNPFTPSISILAVHLCLSLTYICKKVLLDVFQLLRNENR